MLAAGVAGGLRRLVYGVGVADPITWRGVVAVVTGVTLLSSWLPARRAARLAPAVALQDEG